MTIRTRLLIAAVSAALLVGCGQVGSNAPSEPARAATVSDITNALDALDRLASYRITSTTAEPPTEMRAVVINGPPRRISTDWRTDGQVAMSSIEIGAKRWMSLGGSAFTVMDEPGGDEPGGDEPGGDEPGGDEADWDEADWQNPARTAMADPISGSTAVIDLGHESIDGVDTRHLQTHPVTRPAPTDEWGEEPIMDEVGFIGALDVWIAADGGYLVAAHIDGTQVTPRFEDDGEPARRTRLVVHLSVDAVDDPANDVVEPAEASEPPVPDGDPELVAMIEGIQDGLGELTSYVATIESGMAGTTITGTLTVVNRPVPAARMAFGGIQGMDGLSILVIGDDAWARSGNEPWKKATPDEFPTCGVGAGGNGPMERCTFASMTDLTSQLRLVAGSFELIAAGEVINGIEVVHLRSDAPMTSGEMRVPGQTDLWIAADGGYLVRETFVGQALTSTIEIGMIDDPATTLKPPTD